jgi:hypothetical protein
MKNNIFGNDIISYKKCVYKKIIFCVLAITILCISNILLLIFRNNIGKTLSLIVNILLDIVVLSLVTYYFDNNILNDLRILKLFNQNSYVEKGVIEEISSSTIIYNKLECYIIKINNKKYYSPVQSNIEFILNKSVVIKTTKEIILEVSYE